MKPKMSTLCRNLLDLSIKAGMISVGIASLSAPSVWAAATNISDSPVSGAPPSPTNVVFTPSVEFPTASVPAHKDGSYTASKEYLGYFDPNKCYSYDSGTTYFYPVAIASANHACTGSWSGNALNYATMGGIDPFRWALTGGYRAIDTAATSNTSGGRGVTVLQRSYQTGQSTISGRSIPSPSGNVSPNSVGQGLNMVVGSTTYVVRVRVCDDRLGTAFLESNCAAYTDPVTSVVTYKPVGLIQRYQDRMRFGVLSYLYNQYDGAVLNGAVLRARLKNVGSSNWNGTNNTAYEWSPTTGVFVTNPDAADASGSSVSNSGVINYLNKFGFIGGGYEIYDQPSEMYAEALRYLMKMSPTALYYSPAASDARRKDGFPVITNWEDPIIASCQRNAILGIGDVNTHYEDNLGTLPFDPKAWTAKMNAPEGTSGLENMRWGNGGTLGGSNMMAGMAYYAHTNDIRPDIPSKQVKMTVDTFWVDVMEPSGRGVAGHSEYVNKNQYWLAAKYGGFTDVNNNSVFDPGTDTWNTQGRQYFGYDLPDNYYPAADPNAMVAGLQSAFSQISSLQTVGKGSGIVWQNSGGGSAQIYDASYESGSWSGDVRALSFSSFDSFGNILAAPVWTAAPKIDAQNWDTGRLIITGKRSGGTFSGAVPFRLPQLSPEQQATLGPDPVTQLAVLSYLRGNRTGEGSTFRDRDSVLGDVVHSRPVYVGSPKADYLDAFNPGYSAFKTAKNSRMEMLYVGANDGMLHAIKAAQTGPAAANGGQEAWAYIPSILYSGPSNPATPEVDGLQALSKPIYTHHYYVDATPTVIDVDFNRAGTPGTDTTTPDWHSLLVGGLGKGGKGYYAIDVTDPGTVTTEANAASKVLWEFSPADMGFTFGQPLVTKTRAWGWVVIVTSGYNNPSGKGTLYVLNAKNGQLIQQVDTGVGTATNPAGFAYIDGYTQLYNNFLVDQVYGGDLLGNLWRFDMTDPGGAIKVHKLAQLTSPNGQPQPITVAPIIERPIEENIDHRWVFIGTGQFLSPQDISTGSGAQIQTMYAIRDGGRYETEPDSAAVLSRNDLTQVTDLMTGLADTPEKGWYYDLTDQLNGARERIWTRPVSVGDIVSWAGVMPSVGGDACKDSAASGKSNIYAVDFESGKTELAPNGVPVASSSTNGLIVDLQIIVDPAGNPRVFGTNSDPTTNRCAQNNGGNECLGGGGPPINYPLKLNPKFINWRSIN